MKDDRVVQMFNLFTSITSNANPALKASLISDGYVGDINRIIIIIEDKRFPLTYGFGLRY